MQYLRDLLYNFFYYDIPWLFMVLRSTLLEDGWVRTGDTEKLSPIKFDQFIAWFESSVLMVSRIELHRLNSIIDDITEGVLALKQLSSNYRNSLVGLQLSNQTSTGQSNRILKLYDHIDSLAVPFQTGRLYSSHLHDICEATGGGSKKDLVVYHVTSMLPDCDALRDYSADLRHRLKILDEMASSRKNDGSVKNKAGSKSGVATPITTAHNTTAIKDEVKSLQSLLEQLVAEINKKLLVLRYFHNLKAAIHPPIQKLSLQMMKLPSLTDISKQLDDEYHNLKSADELYANMKSTECLMRVKRLQAEMLHLEEVLVQSYQPLQRMDKSLIQELVASTWGTSSECSDGSNDQLEWLEELCILTSLSTGDLLRQLMNDQVKESFTRSVEALQRQLAVHPPATDATSSSEGGLVGYILCFDLELFIAHLDDWTDRVQLHDSLVRKSEFVRSYQQLVSARKALEQSRHRYELCMYQFKEAVTKHTQVGTELHQLKDKFAEIAFQELGARIDFGDKEKSS